MPHKKSEEVADSRHKSTKNVMNGQDSCKSSNLYTSLAQKRRNGHKKDTQRMTPEGAVIFWKAVLIPKNSSKKNDASIVINEEKVEPNQTPCPMIAL